MRLFLLPSVVPKPVRAPTIPMVVANFKKWPEP
jgi:hypothetical protein